jgi:transcriptional regulator with XRE-family HTH domain
MGKKSNKQRIEQFRLDIALLRKKYTQIVIAKRMGTDSGNLSNYSRGHKTPGEDFLDKFYFIFTAEIQELVIDYPISDRGPSLVTGESSQEYARLDERDDHIRTLKLNNDDLRSYLSSVVKSNEILALSNQKLADAQISLIARLDKLNSGIAGK